MQVSRRHPSAHESPREARPSHTPPRSPRLTEGSAQHTVSDTGGPEGTSSLRAELRDRLWRRRSAETPSSTGGVAGGPEAGGMA